ncbi:MAG TPA: 50S ribosomal protein L11 methyltransferase [Solirubrobacteraceae bacterium]|nr:50S ribosomal protein L11 methyltransferase [Solirubrobacteraceae bacterium]
MIRLALRVPREQAELVLAELLELAPAGIEEVEVGEGKIEYAVYGAPGELPGLPDLNAAVGDAVVEIYTSEIADDWGERWKQFHRPILIAAPTSPRAQSAAAVDDDGGRRLPALHVRPPWEAPSDLPSAAVREIVIDPGQAFGTGAHASTRMCLELLLELAAAEPPAGPLVDVGTGSGVLAIAAAALGFDPVLGLDHEQESVVAAAENAAINGVTVDVRRFDLRTQALPWLDGARQPNAASIVLADSSKPDAAPVVLANLLRPLLLELASTMPAAPAHLLASGLLIAEVNEIVEAFAARLGMRERARRASGEWAAVWLTAP